MKLKTLIIVISLFVSTFAVQAQEKAKDHYKAGYKNFKKALYAESIDGFTKAIEMDKNYTDAYFHRAQAYSKTNQPEKAILDYDAVNKLDRSNIEAWLNNGNLNYDLKHYAKAAEKFAVYLADEKKDLGIYGKQIKALYAIQEWQKALHYATLSLNVKETPATFYMIGDLNYILKKYPAAEAAFRSALEEVPGDIKSRNYLAKTLYAEARYDEAIREANTVMASSPNNKTAFMTRVDSYYKKLDFSQAINDISKVIAIYKKDDDILDLINYRGDMYVAFSQHMNAIADYSNVINQDPENIYALYKRAKEYDLIARKDGAIADYEKIVSLADVKKVDAERLNDSKNRLFELNRETNKPEIAIANENFKDDAIRVTFKQKEADIKIIVHEQSKIEDIHVDGGEIVDQYTPDGKYIVPLNNNGDYEYLAKLDLTNRNDFSVTAEDVYGNVATTKYKINRVENDPPDLAFTVPYTDDKHQVFLDSDKPVVYFEGNVNDASLIKSITFNGAIIPFNKDEKNPGFSTSIDISGQSKITVKVTDIYDNTLDREYYLNRESSVLADNNPMGKTWVVFIENSSYESFASLEGPVKDIRLMKSALSNYQISNIIHKQNMTKAQMERFFSIELRDLIKRNRVNSLVIWYAGHGKFLNDVGYWIPVDANRDDEFSYFNINNLKASMQVYNNELTHTLVITDACESGPSFYQAMRSDVEVRSCADESATKFKSSQVFSSAGYELASDNSQFTKTFSNSLINDSEQCVPIESIVLKVTDAVVHEKQQKPQFGKIAGFADENGTFFFIKKQAEITPTNNEDVPNTPEK
jgi:tetratricopeptide (TPR) repeat protein